MSLATSYKAQSIHRRHIICIISGDKGALMFNFNLSESAAGDNSAANLRNCWSQISIY